MDPDPSRPTILSLADTGVNARWVGTASGLRHAAWLLNACVALAGRVWCRYHAWSFTSSGNASHCRLTVQGDGDHLLYLYHGRCVCPLIDHPNPGFTQS